MRYDAWELPGLYTVTCICFYILSELLWISQYALYRSVSWYNRIVTHVSWCVSYWEVLVNTQPWPLGVARHSANWTEWHKVFVLRLGLSLFIQKSDIWTWVEEFIFECASSTEQTIVTSWRPSLSAPVSLLWHHFCAILASEQRDFSERAGRPSQAHTLYFEQKTLIWTNKNC